MILYLFIIGTIALSFYRGRERLPFWQSFAIEAGFLIALLHYGFFSGYWQPHVSYLSFAVGWVLPVTLACLIADSIGRLTSNFRRKKNDETSTDEKKRAILG